MTATPWRAWLHNVAVQVRTITVATQGLGANSCVEDTRTGIEALAHHGITARPVAVDVLAGTRAAYQLVRDGVPVSQWPDDAWTVGVDHREPPRTPSSYNGHLVLTVRDRDGGGGS